MSDSRLIEVVIQPDGTGSIKVDGVDLSNRVNRIELIAQAGETPTVVLTMRAIEVKVIGSAHVSHEMIVLDPDTANEVDEVSEWQQVEEI